MKRLSIAFLLYLLISCKKEKIYDLVIENVSIVDVKEGKLSGVKNIGIKGERIALITEKKLSADAEQVIDGKNKFLIPGLWDMHTHYCWDQKNNDPLLLSNGVTGVREMFGDMTQILKIRESMKNESSLSPEIWTSGPLIDGSHPIWPGSDTVTNAQEAKKVVSDQIKSGVDFLKVYSLLNREAYYAIAEEAKKNKITFVGHVPDQITVYEAMAAGQKSMEHLYGILDVCTSQPQMLSAYDGEKWPRPQKTLFLTRSFSPQKLDSFCQVLAQSETWVCPTLTVLKSTAYIDVKAKNHDPRLKYVSKETLAFWKNFETDTVVLAIEKKAYAYNQLIISAMKKAGAKILAGSDFPNPYCFPGFSLHEEMQLLSESGLGPAAALRAATYHPAVFMNKQKDFGTVEENKIASLVLLDGNPLEKIENTQKISAVIRRGTFFERRDLEELLKNIR